MECIYAGIKIPEEMVVSLAKSRLEQLVDRYYYGKKETQEKAKELAKLHKRINYLRETGRDYTKLYQEAMKLVKEIDEGERDYIKELVEKYRLEFFEHISS